jgi:hypothetical protein
MSRKSPNKLDRIQPNCKLIVSSEAELQRTHLWMALDSMRNIRYSIWQMNLWLSNPNSHAENHWGRAILEYNERGKKWRKINFKFFMISYRILLPFRMKILTILIIISLSFCPKFYKQPSLRSTNCYNFYNAWETCINYVTLFYYP